MRPTTADAYAVNIGRHICNDVYGIGGVPLRALTRPMIQAFYADLERKGRVRGDGALAPKAVHNVHMILRKALEDAVEEGLLPANPARRAHKLPAIHQEMKTWTDAQLAAFLTQLRDDRLYAPWRLAATTGMRRGELLAATWPGLDLPASRLHVTQALSKGPKGAPLRFGPPKTDRGRRAVPLDEETARTLREHRRHQLQDGVGPPSHRGHQLVFRREDGQPLDPDSVSQPFRRLVERTGLPRIRFHDLRHTFATLSLKAGIPTEVVSPDPRPQARRHHPGDPPARGAGARGGGHLPVRRAAREGEKRVAPVSDGYQRGRNDGQTKGVPIPRHPS